MNRFVPPTMIEWQTLLDEAKGWEWTQQGGELLAFNDKCCLSLGLRLKVYTSMAALGENARGCGADAIRVVLVDRPDGRARCKLRRVFRVPGWAARVKKACLEVCEAAHAERLHAASR